MEERGLHSVSPLSSSLQEANADRNRTFAYGCGCVGAVGPLLGAAFVPLAEEWGVGLSDFIAGAQGGVIAAIAIGSLLWNALAVKYGKRPVYLITSVGLAVTCFWAAEARSFGNFVAARVIQGLCMSPMEALIPASIADVWFVHERGLRTAIFNLGVLGGINLATPIAGAIIQNSSWRVCMHAMGGAFVLQLILTFLFMPETAFHRTGALNIDTSQHNIETEKHLAADHMETSEKEPASVTTAERGPSEPKMSFAKEMLPWSGYVNHVSLMDTMIRPFFLLASPAVAWATLLFTTCISWLVGISITLSQIFSAPPYNFSIASVGATNVSSFVATLLATAIAGPTIDGIVKRMSKRNKGTFEPEFRLPVMVTYLLFTATGFFGWGQSAYVQAPWPVPVVVCMGLINLGVQLGTTGVVAYVVDCHREQAGEAFAAMNFVKNMFAFGMTFYIK
jgi:MFS family permease